MYCDECGQTLGHGHHKWCNTLKPGYRSFEDTLRANLDERVQQIKVLELQVEALAGALQRLRLALREETKGGLRMSLNLAGAFGNAIAMIREFAPAWDGVEHVSKSEKKVEDKQ